MLKKTMPFLLVSGLALGACGLNNGALPANNEGPVENVDERERNWTPNVRDERQGGTNLDGIDDETDVNGNGIQNGVINDTGPNDAIIEEMNPDSNINNR